MYVCMYIYIYIYIYMYEEGLGAALFCCAVPSPIAHARDAALSWLKIYDIITYIYIHIYVYIYIYI